MCMFKQIQVNIEFCMPVLVSDLKMKMAFSIKDLACLLFLLTVKADNPIVTVEQGQIIGKQLEFSAGGSQYTVDAFIGIPYAEAPVGELRFKPPVAKVWSGELNAQNYGPACPQLPFPLFDYFTAHTGEDCLVLNVFVPESKPTGSAVMVFIHGGGYGIGAGSALENYDFHPISGIGNVIGVTINYRLNVLGFLSTGDEIVPGNNGMLDQVEALKWVQKNIAAFGGDPNRVTIFGESAGAGSVSLHTLSPLSKGLFSQAIMQSGTANAEWASNADTENFAKRAFAYGKLVGCEQDDTKQLVHCLRDVSVDDLVNATQRIIEVLPEDPAMIPFAPVVDGHFLPKSTSDLLNERKFNHINVMVGYTADEGMLLPSFMIPDATDKPKFNATEFNMFVGATKITAAFDPLKRAAIDLVYVDNAMMASPEPDYFDSFVNINTDFMFACPSVKYLKEAFEAKLGRVYAYYFNHHPSSSFFNKVWTKANHGDDLMFFGFCFLKNDFELTEEESQMTFRMIKYWTNFAKTGNPNTEFEEGATSVEEEDWPQYTSETRVYKELAPAMKNIIDPNGSRCRVWNDFLPALDKALAEAESKQEKCTSQYAEENQETCTTDDCKP